MSTPETKLKAKVDKLLKSYGKKVWFFKPVSSGMGKHGIPDYIICANGHFLAVETKAGSKDPTKLQLLQLRQIGEARGYPMVTHSHTFEHLKDIIDSCLVKPSPWADRITIV